MCQGDLFDGSANTERRVSDLTGVSDPDLVVLIAGAGLATAPELATEACRRRLEAAIPSLQKLCERFIGWGADRILPEQKAALEALECIGGSIARHSVTELINRQIVQGPNLALAVGVAARLGAVLTPEKLLVLLNNSDPIARSNACGCVCIQITGSRQRLLSRIAPRLRELLDDPNPIVPSAAAGALGRIGVPDGRVLLLRLLAENPTPEVINDLVPIADDETIVALGRIGRGSADLAPIIIAALEMIDDRRAAALATSLRQQGEFPSVDTAMPNVSENGEEQDQ